MFEELDLSYIEYAHQDALLALSPHVDRVLDIVGRPDAWVDEDAVMGDFGLSQDDLALAGHLLGLPVGEDDYLYAVAFRLQARAS